MGGGRCIMSPCLLITPKLPKAGVEFKEGCEKGSNVIMWL
jgi:hypothetical protein